MTDVKKLITGFLVLAVSVVSSGIILFRVSSSSPQAKNLADTVSSPTDVAGTTPVGTNAFVPQEAQSPAETPDLTFDPNAVALATKPTDPNNLTERVASAVLGGVIAANPNGLQTDQSGSPSFTTPDVQNIALGVATSSAITSLKIPNWDLEAEAQQLKIIPDASPAAISQYSANLNDITSRRFISTNLTSIVNTVNPDPGQIDFVATQVKGALRDTTSLNAPSSLSGLQKSLVKIMVYEKNTLALIQSANDDPIKTSLILQSEQDKYNAAIQNLRTEMQKASAVQGFSFNAASHGADLAGTNIFFANLLGIKTAHAQWLTFDAANFGQWILKFVQDIALQILKNTLISLVQKKVLAWIQGSGAPRFITDWATTIVNAYTQTAISAIDKYSQCVYPAIAPQLRLTLNVFYHPSTNACLNIFASIVKRYSLNQFFDSFSKGGWVAFGATALPTNNAYGAIGFAAQTVSYTAQGAQDATVAKIGANQGLKGDEVCPDGQNPNGNHKECKDAFTGTTYAPTCNKDGTCRCAFNAATESLDGMVDVANNGLCPGSNKTGFPKVTTPGVFTGFAANSAVDASPKQLAAANSIAGLLNSLISSLLFSLANLAINKVNGLVDGALSGNNGGILSIDANGLGGSTSTATSTVQNLPLSCNPPNQTVSTTVKVNLGAVGGTLDDNANPPTYFWDASDGATSTGPIFNDTFNQTGTYAISLTDSAEDPTSTCQVVVVK